MTAAHLVYANPALDGAVQTAAALIDHAAEALGRDAEDEINRNEARAAGEYLTLLLREDLRRAPPQIRPMESVVIRQEDGVARERTLMRYMTHKTRPFADLHRTLNAALQSHQVTVQKRGNAPPTQKNRNARYHRG